MNETVKKYQQSSKEERHQHAGHAAMSEDLDTSLGQLFQTLHDLKIFDNTYITYLADNGSIPLDNIGNTSGPLHGWKATIWEGGIRVPFIIAGPGILKGKQSDTPVVGYDLFPTISQLLKLKSLPEGIEGGSFVQVLTDHRIKKVKRENDFLVFHWPHYTITKRKPTLNRYYQREK